MSTSDEQLKTLAAANFLTGGGEMGALIREFDWASTPIGPVESWSPALRTMVSILLANRFPLLLWWGPQYIQLYNDPYRPILGAKHPVRGLGRPVSECWSEIWSILRPLIDTPFQGGPATWMEDIPLEINRHGFVEETHFTIAYSPVPDETVASGIGGVLATVHEITEKIVAERRVAALRDLGARTGDAKTTEEACAIAARTLTGHDKDVPFALLYLIDADGKRARLASSAGIEMGEAASPIVVDLTEKKEGGWPLADAMRAEDLQVVERLNKRFASIPSGPWSDPPDVAVVMPIPSNKPRQPVGLLVGGVSARLKLDESYRGFFELVTTQVATAIANARAYEEERSRAEALAEIDRAKTAFFSNVSHEFRTPLTLMLGPLEDVLTQNNRLPAADRERLEATHRNSLRLLKLVNTLLDFSRIEAGRIQASYEPTDLAAFTSGLASVFRSTVERAGMRLVVNCPPLDEPVYVDQEMWEKIVLNLLSNAFKFSFDGEIEVKLESAGDSVELTVQDTGIGIAEEELPRLFERFHRVQGARGRTYEGSGIGLALVQELVRLHGGTVRVESEVGRGSAFIVSVPRGFAHLPAERVGAQSVASTETGATAYVEEALRWLPDNNDRVARPPAETGVTSGSARILLADDNADMREYMRRLLAENYEVTAVADGKAALAAALERPPDLILTDVMMPQLDGFGLLRKLRSDERTATVPVIMLSARAGEEAQVEGMEAGADDYLIKPFSARELLARVGARLEMSRIRREAVSEVRESERRFRHLADNAPVMVWTSEPDASRTFLSKSWYEFTGQSPETGLGFGWIDAVHPDDRETARRSFLTANERHEAFRLDYRLRRKDGEYRWAIDSAAPRFGPQGSFLGYIGSVIDITEYKSAEAAVAQIAAIVESSDDAIISKDLNGIIASWNKGAEKLFGYAAEEVIGKSVMILIPPDRADEEPQILKRIRSGERVDHYETVRRRKDGSEIDISLTVSPIRDKDGTIVGASKIARDISERKRIEIEREEMLLRESAARAEAEAANRSKDEFLADVSHELRSPLNSILGWNRLLRDERSADQYIAQVTDIIERAGRAQLQLIEDLLDTRRIVSGKMRLEVEAIELSQVIVSAIEIVRPAAEGKSIAIIPMLDPGAEQITGDPDRLQQVVWNLLSNAVKFTPAHGRIYVELRRGPSEARIVVRDTGEGIGPDLLPYVFDTFKQGDTSTPSRPGGLGLGLAIVKHLVELHGGRVAVESQGKGMGATFTVSLPTRAARAEDNEAAASKSSINRYRFHGLRVLVVDDEEDARELVATTLALCGARVTRVESAAAALVVLESRNDEGPFDLIISDIGMPGEDGYSLLRKLRSLTDESLSRVPAVALTSHARFEDRMRALQAGFQAHVAKPVETKELIAVIAGLIGHLQRTSAGSD